MAWDSHALSPVTVQCTVTAVLWHSCELSIHCTGVSTSSSKTVCAGALLCHCALLCPCSLLCHFALLCHCPHSYTPPVHSVHWWCVGVCCRAIGESSHHRPCTGGCTVVCTVAGIAHLCTGRSPTSVNLTATEKKHLCKEPPMLRVHRLAVMCRKKVTSKL